jgi:hypothetical protein
VVTITSGRTLVVVALLIVSLVAMALGRMAGQRAAGDTEGERESCDDGEKIPLQRHLPTDFAG